MHPKEVRIEDYAYDLPNHRIAKYPLSERDASRLLIYREGEIHEDTYRNVASHIPEETLIVFNRTRVVNARLLFTKPTGGVIEVFCLEPHEQYGDVQLAMAQKGKVWWKCMIGGASKWKHGMVLTETFRDGFFTLRAAIIERETGSFTLELAWDNDSLSFAEVLQVAGRVPLPPYLHREADNDDRERYQTIYATVEGSVAAPTAGLHFTEAVMASLAARGIETDFVTLHVGAGTFKPVKSETMLEHDMHAEWIDVSIDLVQSLIAHLPTGIVAVGTTSLRTIESLYWIGAKILNHTIPAFSGVAVGQWDPYEIAAMDITATQGLQALLDWMLQNHYQHLVTRTQVLIAPSYQFRIVKGLITNFHQSQSTLLLLVAALIGKDWRKVYEYALNNDFRFLSYGDGSLLWGAHSPQ
jgi:S-adenosylmethionine:tRNA ribosyltransferase-isomerase